MWVKWEIVKLSTQGDLKVAHIHFILIVFWIYYLFDNKSDG